MITFPLSCLPHTVIMILYVQKPELSLKWHVTFKNINLHFQCLHKSDDFLLLSKKTIMLSWCVLLRTGSTSHMEYIYEETDRIMSYPEGKIIR
jgi:hypothetical protein